MTAQVKHRERAARKSAATNDRNFRTFLLVSQLEAEGIGQRIAYAREVAGLTQEQLADLAVGFSKRSLQDYEAGVTIPYKHLREIGRLLGRDPEWFLYGDKDELSADEISRLHEQVEGLRERLDEILRRLP